MHVLDLLAASMIWGIVGLRHSSKATDAGLLHLTSLSVHVAQLTGSRELSVVGLFHSSKATVVGFASHQLVSSFGCRLILTAPFWARGVCRLLVLLATIFGVFLLLAYLLDAFMWKHGGGAHTLTVRLTISHVQREAGSLSTLQYTTPPPLLVEKRVSN
jgi:hypothetical protein